MAVVAIEPEDDDCTELAQLGGSRGRGSRACGGTTATSLLTLEAIEEESSLDISVQVEFVSSVRTLGSSSPEH